MATKVLGGLIYCICQMYIDVCTVYAKGNAEFLVRLEQVFQCFRLWKSYLKASKCKCRLPRVEYVEMIVHRDRLSMSQEILQSVLDFLLPSDETVVSSGWLIAFVRSYHLIVRSWNHCRTRMAQKPESSLQSCGRWKGSTPSKIWKYWSRGVHFSIFWMM